MSTFASTLYTLSTYESSRDASTVQRIWREAKVRTGCESSSCFGHPADNWVLDAAHIDSATKYRTADGRTVEPADMVKSDGRGRTRYALATILREAEKCRILCKNCHAVETRKDR